MEKPLLFSLKSQKIFVLNSKDQNKYFLTFKGLSLKGRRQSKEHLISAEVIKYWASIT